MAKPTGLQKFVLAGALLLMGPWLFSSTVLNAAAQDAVLILFHTAGVQCDPPRTGTR